MWQMVRQRLPYPEVCSMLSVALWIGLCHTEVAAGSTVWTIASDPWYSGQSVLYIKIGTTRIQKPADIIGYLNMFCIWKVSIYKKKRIWEFWTWAGEVEVELLS